jgi:hypothetical protein
LSGLPISDRDRQAPRAVYLNCPRCGLSIRSKPDRPAIEHCPRCIARARVAVRLFASTMAMEQLYAAE